MREKFLQAVAQLEYEDRLFQASLSSKVMMATSLETWAVAREVAEKLFELVLLYKPQTIVEVGTSLGYSTMWLAEAARSYGGKIITLEHEESKIKKTQELFDYLELQNTVTLIHTDAKDFLKNFTGQIDFLFLDALKRDYLEYIKLAEKNLQTHSIVCADDVVTWKRKVEDFLNHMQAGEYQTEILELGHGLLIAKKRK
jgi:predicted O-methyltransferase YrrM